MKSKYIFYIAAVCICLILPDVIFALNEETFKLSTDPKAILLLFPLSCGLFFAKRPVAIVFLFLMFLMQIMQFAHISYFKTQISPYGMHLMTNEFADVFVEAKSSFFKHWHIFPIVTIPFYIILYIINANKSKFHIGSILLFLVFASTGIRLYRSETPRFLPNEIRFSIDNSIKAFWGYWIIHIKNYSIKSYIKYDVIDINSDLPEEVNIVYIIGESVNYNHMSLFGYGRDTTPHLKNLAKNHDFYYTKAIAGSISTLSSIKFMTSVIREADNTIQTSSDETNLFRLAKMKGFRTFYISSQTEHLISGIGSVGYIDKIITKDLDILSSNKYMDEFLFTLLDQQIFSKRNFIVLHQRCIHAPYSKTYSETYKNRNIFSGADNKTIDEYDNAMLYNDFLISNLFKRFNKQKNGKFYIIWASDHNELLGEAGLFGHGHGYLVPQTADIPLLVQTNDPEYLSKIKKIFKPTHFEVAESIAEIMGYRIVNKNAEQNVFYISGIDWNGKCGFIKVIKDPAGKVVSYEPTG